MDELIIVTRDVNGYMLKHYLLWDRVCKYIEENPSIRDTEILLVIYEGTCIYSGLGATHALDWDDITGFFA